MRGGTSVAGRFWTTRIIRNRFPGMPQSLRCSMGSITMADHTPRYRSSDYDVDIRDKSLIDRRVAPYKSGQSARTDSHAEDPVPLFLSDYDGEPGPSEYMAPLRQDRRLSGSSRILA